MFKRLTAGFLLLSSAVSAGAIVAGAAFAEDDPANSGSSSADSG